MGPTRAALLRNQLEQDATRSLTTVIRVENRELTMPSLRRQPGHRRPEPLSFVQVGRR